MLGCSQSPLDVTTANLRLVKNVVELQKFDQELRVSYKPTRFSGWVVDIVATIKCVLAEIDAVDDGDDYFFAGRVVHHGAVSL